MKTTSPLRYPGGKGNLSGFVKMLFAANDLCDGEYAEPYCGGAGVAIELLRSEFASKIHLNDLDPAIHCFWASVFLESDDLCERIGSARINVRSWSKQRRVLATPKKHSMLDVGFATFFLNRVNRSGILNAGPIGGIHQSGDWTMDARFNRERLVECIRSIARFKDRVELYCMDAGRFVRDVVPELPQRSLVYFDPPYVHQGKRLYQNWYDDGDHALIAAKVLRIKRVPWIVSYDSVPLIRKLYASCRQMTYRIGYSANERTSGSEVMVFSPDLVVPAVASPVSISGREWRKQRSAA